MSFRGKGRRGAFTLIELLITVLIIAILLSVALPLFISAVSDSELKTCRNNQQSIANAVQAKRVQNTDSDYSPAINGGVASLQPDLGNVVCPQRGSYSIVNGSSGDASTYRVECSIAAHGTYEPGHQ